MDDSVNGGSWYQTDTAGPALNVSANDPAGVCAIGVQWNGPDAYYTQATDDNPGMENPGSPVGSEFDSITPCGGSSAGGTVTMPAGIASGTYSLAILASNPGNLAGRQRAQQCPDDRHLQQRDRRRRHDSEPRMGQQLERLDRKHDRRPRRHGRAVRRDLGRVHRRWRLCDSEAHLGIDERQRHHRLGVPMTDTAGANSVSCNAANGDVNGALSANSPTATFNVDTTVPTVSFADPGYTSGDWTNASQTVTVSATGGPSGVNGVSCLVDGIGAPMGGANANQVSVSGDGSHCRLHSHVQYRESLAQTPTTSTSTPTNHP